MNLKQAAEELQAGRACTVSVPGHSMEPRIKSRQPVRIKPLEGDPAKGDVVLAKVRGNMYLHLVAGVAQGGKQFLIANNHGHVNGWTKRSQVYGRAEV